MTDYEFCYAVYYGTGVGAFIHDEFPTQDKADAEIQRLKPMYPTMEFWVHKFMIKPYRDSGWYIYPLGDVTNDALSPS